jgi:hypothetical protein
MRILLILLLFANICQAQVGQENEVRITIDPSVLINESNYNIKVEFESGTYGDNRHRITFGLEMLTGHKWYAGSAGYGYHIPYRIGNVHFAVQPSVNIGRIWRTLNDEGFSFNYWSLELKHHLAFGDYWGLYAVNRFITRNDVQYQVDYTIPYFRVENAIGLYLKL